MSNYIKVTVNQVIEYAKEVGIRGEPARSLAALLLMNSKSSVRNVKRVKRPKLDAVKNPRSKYYDDTSSLTKRLSLLWFQHQRGKRRLKHERITDNDRQWVFLVQIKQAIVKHFGSDISHFISAAKELFNQGERVCYSQGKRNLYLGHIIGMLEELLDKTATGLDIGTVTVREAKTYRAYRIRRKKVTGISYAPKLLEPGSEDHLYIRDIVVILLRYDISAKLFMNIQFDAFAVHDSFPRLSNLVTPKAVDRLEQGIVKYRKQIIDDKDEEYWNELKDRIEEQQRRKANN